jgi:hypothetical protein
MKNWKKRQLLAYVFRFISVLSHTHNHVVFYLSSVIAQGKTVAYREPLWGCLTIKKVW